MTTLTYERAVFPLPATVYYSTVVEDYSQYAPSDCDTVVTFWLGAEGGTLAENKSGKE